MQSRYIIQTNFTRNPWFRHLNIHPRNPQLAIVASSFYTRRNIRKVTDTFSKRDQGILSKVYSLVFPNISNHSPSKNAEFRSLLNQYSESPEVQQFLVKSYFLGQTDTAKNNEEFARRARNRNLWRSLFAVGLLCGTLYYLTNALFSGLSQGLKNTSLGQFFSTKAAHTLIKHVDTRFSDVKGCDETKKELVDIIRFLRDPHSFNEMGAELPKGILLEGGPGVGKTLMARAVAGEAGVPFLHISGSQFEEMWVGIGASRVRSLFEEARNLAPCVIFIDELDTVGARRSTSSMHPFANHTINQLLGEMDGFKPSKGIVVIGATNRAHVIDEALKRPGRFDMTLSVAPPDFLGRLELVKFYLSKVKCDPKAADNSEAKENKKAGGDATNKHEMRFNELASKGFGFTGADIQNWVNQAAILAAQRNHHNGVTMADLWDSLTKIQLGAAKSRFENEQDRVRTAYHEGGHALVQMLSPHSAESVHMASILRRGQTGGHTSMMPKHEDKYSQTREELLAKLDVFMGGKVAEEIVYGKERTSNGCSSDVQACSRIARNMVERFCMSDKVGLRYYADQKQCDCGGAWQRGVDKMLDDEVRNLLDVSRTRTHSLLNNHKAELERLKDYLMRYETLTRDDMEAIVRHEKPPVELRHERQMQADKKTAELNKKRKRSVLNIFSGGGAGGDGENGKS